MGQGRFDTDAAALTRRIEAHGKYGSNDLNDWIFGLLVLREGLSILDLGCGTGKQTIPMANAVGETGRLFSVDLSQDALNLLSTSARELGLERRITACCSALDDLEQHLPPGAFDVVLACYSLYYGRDSAKVFDTVHRALRAGGVFLFCGPAKDNNFELKRFHYALDGQRTPAETGAAVFMEETGPYLARRRFRRVEIFRFENPLRFDSAEALYRYWSSYNLYEQKLDNAFRAAAAKHFQSHSVFETTKRAIGVRTLK